MKTCIIELKDLEKHMNLIKYESQLVYALSYFEETSKLQLKRLESIKNISRILADHKNGPYAEWWKQLSPELKKTIVKYSSPYHRH